VTGVNDALASEDNQNDPPGNSLPPVVENIGEEIEADMNNDSD
jgi:hypothetical protein